MHWCHHRSCLAKLLHATFIVIVSTKCLIQLSLALFGGLGGWLSFCFRIWLRLYLEFSLHRLWPTLGFDWFGLACQIWLFRDWTFLQTISVLPSAWSMSLWSNNLVLGEEELLAFLAQLAWLATSLRLAPGARSRQWNLLTQSLGLWSRFGLCWFTLGSKPIEVSEAICTLEDVLLDALELLTRALATLTHTFLASIWALPRFWRLHWCGLTLWLEASAPWLLRSHRGPLPLLFQRHGFAFGIWKSGKVAPAAT